MKKLILIIISIFLFIPFKVHAFDVNYVYDNVDILSYDTENFINEKSFTLYEQTNIDYYVITINSTDNIDLEDYTDNLFSEYDISDNGILIVLSKNDRMIRVKIGTLLSNEIDNATCDGYINLYFMPFFKRNLWDRGILNGYSSFYKLVCDKNDINCDIVVLEDVDFITKYKDIILFIVIWLNTIFAYIFCRYFIDAYRENYKFKLIDSILFGIILLINILLLLFIYSISLIYFLFVFILELVTIYYNITSVHLDNINKRRNKTNKKKKDICYNKKQGGKHEKKRSR